MLIKLSYKAMLIKKMKERQDRLMLQLGEHRLPVKGSCVLLTPEQSRNCRGGVACVKDCK